MKFDKAVLLDTIDAIVKEHESTVKKWHDSVATFNRKRLIDWRRDEWPKWKKLQALIQAKTRSRGPITTEDLAAIFPGNRSHSAPHIEWHLGDYAPRGNFELNGETVYPPPTYPVTGASLKELEALRNALNMIKDETVSDAQLAKIGFKDLAPVFRRAVELGGMTG